jgi:hypothetical protein
MEDFLFRPVERKFVEKRTEAERKQVPPMQTYV